MPRIRAIGSGFGANMLDATSAAEQEWGDAAQSELATSAWISCDSWYRDPRTNRFSSNWRGGIKSYERRTRALDPTEFTIGSIR